MRKVLVEAFGGADMLRVVETSEPPVGAGEVRVRLLSVGVNRADVMARRGTYKLLSGDPPFTPGIEGGGVIEAVGSNVTDRHVGQRVVLTLDAPRRAGPGASLDGTYATHYVCAAAQTIPAPDGLPDEQLGAVWLTYLTAWGCLVWKHGLRPGQVVALPGASSGVALAAAQVAKRHGATTVGLTSSPEKARRLLDLPTARYDHLIVTHDGRTMRPWRNDLKRLAPASIDVFFDPVAAGEYLDAEVKSLARRGVIYVYGLLGQPGVVDVWPLIRKHGSIRGWLVGELHDDPAALARGCRHILDGLADGSYAQHVERVFRLDEAVLAHRLMEENRHVGKLVLRP